MKIIWADHDPSWGIVCEPKQASTTVEPIANEQEMQEWTKASMEDMDDLLDSSSEAGKEVKAWTAKSGRGFGS